MSEDFRHCFERDVTEGWSMSWYFDIDEGRLEDEAMSGSISGMRIVVGSISIRARRRPDRDRTAPVIQGKQAPRPANEIGLGANSNEL